MTDPLSKLISYTVEILDDAFKDICELLSFSDKRITPLDWRIQYNSENGSLSTARVFQLATELHLTPNSLARKLQTIIADPNKTFSTITADSGYINFQISESHLCQMLRGLRKWLIQPAQAHGKPLTLVIPQTTSLNSGQNLHLSIWLEAYGNLSHHFGRPLQVKIAKQDAPVMECKELNIQTPIGTIIGDISLVTPHIIKLISLRGPLKHPATINKKDLKLHIDNPLYLTDYLSDIFQRHAYPMPRSPIISEITLKFLEYPLLIRNSWHSMSFTAILHKIFILEQLTLKYYLWQNCNEKYNILADIYLLQNHFFNIIDCHS